MNYIIIGNGIAGTEAALNIRKADESGSITIITDSGNLHYYRPRLVDYLSGETSLEKFTTYNEEFYEKNNITNRLNTTISSINTKEQTVLTDKGESFSYDKLLLATGARAFLPPITGSDKKGVFTLRTAADTEEIKEFSEGITDIVVVGGGLLGLENANSLMKLGKKVTVIEAVEWLLPRQLDMSGGIVLQKLLEEKGLKFILNDSVSSIDGDHAVSSITLKSGEKIETNSLVISAGIRCNLELAKTSGIETNLGIIVNNLMETSIKNIYAAGDAVEHEGKVYGLWAPAKEQGAIAGSNMAGKEDEYKGSTISTILKVTGIDLFSSGDIHSVNGTVKSDTTDSTYKKLITDNKGTQSAIVVGDKKSISIARKVISGKAEPEEFISDK
jgi:nitrite reductase (NADH) large subunit